MGACAPTLMLFYRKGRWYDLCAYTFGFVVAIIYHMLHLYAHGGLASVSFLGIHGAAWRTIDILGANALLARTMGHALNVDHPFIAVLPNVVLPTALVVLLLSGTTMGVPLASRVTAGIVGVTLVLQLVKGGYDMIQNWKTQYSHPRAIRAFTSMAVGIFAFSMPAIADPENYYLWHSAWHVLMGAGYWDLYVHLLSAQKDKEDAATTGKNALSIRGSSGSVRSVRRLENSKAASAAEQRVVNLDAGVNVTAARASSEEIRAAVASARAAIVALARDEVSGTGADKQVEGELPRLRPRKPRQMA